MRQAKDAVLRGLLWASALVSIGVLLLIVGFIFYKGIGYISFDFIFGDYSPTGGGGILPMIVTTILMTLPNYQTKPPNLGQRDITRGMDIG